MGVSMKKRSSGILLHITSLPSRYGVGDLGPGAYKFVDFLDVETISLIRQAAPNAFLYGYDGDPWPQYQKTNIALLKNVDEPLGLYMLNAQEGYCGYYDSCKAKEIAKFSESEHQFMIIGEMV